MNPATEVATQRYDIPNLQLRYGSLKRGSCITRGCSPLESPNLWKRPRASSEALVRTDSRRHLHVPGAIAQRTERLCDPVKSICQRATRLESPESSRSFLPPSGVRPCTR